MSNRQEDNFLLGLVDPIDYSVIAYSKAVAALELSPQSLARMSLSLKGFELSVDSMFDVRSQLPKVFLELPGSLESKAHGIRGVLGRILGRT